MALTVPCIAMALARRSRSRETPPRHTLSPSQRAKWERAIRLALIAPTVVIATLYVAEADAELMVFGGVVALAVALNLYVVGAIVAARRTR